MNGSSSPGWVQDREFYWSLVLIFAVGLAFTLLPADFNWSSDTESENAAGGSLIRKLQWLPLFMIGGVVLMFRYYLALALLRKLNPFLWLFIGWAVLSMGWSDQPGTTLRKCVQLIGVVVMAMAFCCASWRPQRFQQALLPMMMIIILVSFPFSILFPEMGVHSGLGVDGKWQGVTNHKNSLGLAAALAMTIWVHAWAAREISPSKAALGAGICVLTMLLAGSATAFAVAGMGSVIVVGVLRSPIAYQGRLLVWFTRLLLFLAIPYFLISLIWGIPGIEDLAAPVAELFGKDITFSRRSDIWRMVVDEMGGHLVQGTGYGAFWLGPDSRVDYIIDELHWTPWQAHNGYIDILNETGLIGFGLVMGFLIAHGWHLARVAKIDPASFALHLSFFVFLVASNIFESTMFRTITMEYLISILSSVTLSRILLEHELRAQYAVPAVNGIGNSPQGAT